MSVNAIELGYTVEDAARLALAYLEEATIEDFTNGGDRDVRRLLRSTLGMEGE